MSPATRTDRHLCLFVGFHREMDGIAFHEATHMRASSIDTDGKSPSSAAAHPKFNVEHWWRRRGAPRGRRRGSGGGWGSVTSGRSGILAPRRPRRVVRGARRRVFAARGCRRCSGDAAGRAELLPCAQRWRRHAPHGAGWDAATTAAKNRPLRLLRQVRRRQCWPPFRVCSCTCARVYVCACVCVCVGGGGPCGGGERTSGTSQNPSRSSRATC